jgi:CRISPR/Cas system-associated endonuclease Cas1
MGRGHFHSISRDGTGVRHRDAVNALLSLAYSLLAKDFTIACYGVGFDPFIGYYIISRGSGARHWLWT